MLFKSSKFGVHHTTKTQELTTQRLRWHELSWSCDQILCKKKKRTVTAWKYGYVSPCETALKSWSGPTSKIYLIPYPPSSGWLSVYVWIWDKNATFTCNLHQPTIFCITSSKHINYQLISCPRVAILDRQHLLIFLFSLILCFWFL